MNIFLWVLQVLLAALYLWHGMLLLFPPAELVEIMNAEFALWFRIFLGVAEVLAAAGLIAPGVARILPRLIPVTAACLMIVMAGATILHASKGETESAMITAVLLCVLGFLACMRWKVKPIQSQTTT